jgi:hypothetical protein
LVFKVMDDELNVYDSFEDVQDPSVDPNMRRIMRPTLWPPGPNEDLGLEKCMRFYPHLQDTGRCLWCGGEVGGERVF